MATHYEETIMIVNENAIFAKSALFRRHHRDTHTNLFSGYGLESEPFWNLWDRTE